MIIGKGIVQNTPEWFAARTGIPTSSYFDKIVTSKGEPSKSRIKYIYQLAAERITGVKEETYSNSIMQRAMEREEEARNMYELISGETVTTVGICYLNKKKLFSCSPDGLVGDDGLVEIKCPIATTQVKYLLDGKVPIDYVQQLQGQLFVTGRKWVDFFSYYPGLKPLLIRVTCDPAFTSRLQKELLVVCNELDEITEKLRKI